ncbi:MAG: hypothetical protein ACTSUO_07645 [Candidatus Thorarchaeota archaeon]
MKSKSILQLAFENIAAHISNLDIMQDLLLKINEQDGSIDEVMKLLEDRLDSSEVTFRTDIRILLNEIKHIISRKSKE